MKMGTILGSFSSAAVFVCCCFFFGHCRNGWINMSSILMESINLSSTSTQWVTQDKTWQSSEPNRRREKNCIWFVVFDSFSILLFCSSSNRQLTLSKMSISIRFFFCRFDRSFGCFLDIVVFFYLERFPHCSMFQSIMVVSDRHTTKSCQKQYES